MLVFILDVAALGFIGGVPNGVLRFAPGVLDFALHFLSATLDLLFGVAGPLACLTLRASRHFINLTFHSILIHFSPFLALEPNCLKLSRIAPMSPISYC